jgi:hypothetical protein
MKIYINDHFNSCDSEKNFIKKDIQEGHDGPEVAHLYKGPPERGQFKPQGFYLNKLGRHPLEDVSC